MVKGNDFIRDNMLHNLLKHLKPAPMAWLKEMGIYPNRLFTSAALKRAVVTAKRSLQSDDFALGCGIQLLAQKRAEGFFREVDICLLTRDGLYLTNAPIEEVMKKIGGAQIDEWPDGKECWWVTSDFQPIKLFEIPF